MSKLKTGPTEGLHKEQPQASKEADRRLATDFYLTFNTDPGKNTLRALRGEVATVPRPDDVNPNERAWYYNGMLAYKTWIEKMIKQGEKVNQHGG